MSGETCNIFGRRINKQTRQLADTTSQLHSDLLDLTKQAKSVKQKRNTANKMFLITQSPTFEQEYFEKLYPKAKGQTYQDMISKDPYIEPSLWHLYATLQGIQDPDNYVIASNTEVEDFLRPVQMPSLQEAINYFNAKFAEHTYDSYEDALEELRKIGEQGEYTATDLYVLTVAMNENGEFVLQAVENTPENQQKILDDISSFQNATLLVDELQRRGIDVGIVNSIKDSLIRLSPQESQGVVDNMQAIVQTSAESFNAQLAYKTALLIIQALEKGNKGKPHPLVERLKRQVKAEYQIYRHNGRFTPFLRQLKDSNPELWNALEMGVGADETQLAAFVLAGYLENMESTEKYIRETSGIRKLIDRIIDWFKALFSDWKNIRGLKAESWVDRYNPTRSIDFANTKMRARTLSLQIVKSFLGDTDKLEVSRVDSGRLNMRQDTKILFDSLTEGLQELDFTLQKLKDLNYNAWKVFNKQLKDRITHLHVITKDIEDAMKSGTSAFDDIQIQMEMLQELVSLMSFVGENLNGCKESLSQVVWGKDKDNQPLQYNESAKLVKYAESILNLANDLTKAENKIMSHFDASIEFTDANGFTYTMGDYMANLKRAFENIRDITNNMMLTSFEGNEKKCSMKEALVMAREKIGTDLLVEINGGEFIAIEQYISKKHGKVLRNAAKVYHMNKDLWHRVIQDEDSVDCCPPSQFISKFIDAMADSPDIVNQMIHDKVSQQKHAANIKSLNMVERLRELYRNIPKHNGIRNTRRYMETDDDGKLTGNILTSRHYGKWEKAFADFKKNYEATYFLEHREEFKSMDEMLADKMYLVEYGKAVERWHQYNSKKVTVTHAKDNSPVTYKDGSKKQMYVPLLEEEREERENLLISRGYNLTDQKVVTYNNEEFDKLDEEDKKWIKEYLTIKQELDDLLPQGSTPLGGIRVPQFRATLTNKMGNLMQQGIYNAATSIVKYIKLQGQAAIGESPFETEFGGEHDTYDSDLYDNEGNIIFTRAHSNKIQTIPHLPLYGVRKLPDQDLLSTDLCSSLLAYASMAYNYEALDQVVSAIEVTRDGLKDQRVGTTGYTVADQQSMSSQEAGMYGRLEDYINQQMYNIYTDSNKSRFNRAIRKLFNKIARIGSLYYLGFNMHGGTVNALTGFYQILRRAMKGEGFSFGSMVKAHIVYFMGIERTKGRVEKVKNLFGSPGSDYSATHDGLRLFQKRYNVSNSNQREFKDWHIATFGYRFSFKQSLSDLMHLCYSFFDDYMSTVPYLATAIDTKLMYETVDKNGNKVKKRTNLWNAINNSIEYDENTKSKQIKFDYDKYYIIDKNATDVMNGKPVSELQDEWNLEKQRYHDDKSTFYIDEENSIVYRKYDEQQDNRFRNRAQMNNNAMHGIYNTQDAGAMMRFAAAGAIASLRKYAIGLFDDRFARARYDFRTRSIKQGDYVTLMDVILLGAIYDPIDVWKENEGFGKLRSVLNLLKFIGVMVTLPTQLLLGNIDPVRHKQYFINMGLSKSQIRNLNGVMADQVICYLMEILLSFIAPPGMEPPPDDEEDLDAFFNDEEKLKQYKEKIRSEKYTLAQKLQRALKGNFHILAYYPFGKNPDGGRDFYIEGEKAKLDWFEDAMLNIYMISESLMPFEMSPYEEIPGKEDLTRVIYEKGVDHKNWHINKDGEIVFSKHRTKGTLPFSFKGICYYTTYRNLVEMRAYNPLYFAQMATEFRSILSSSLPGTQATVDAVSLGVQLAVEALSDNPPEIKRGINEGYYKFAKRFEKSMFNPLRSFASVYVSGYQAQENFQFFLDKEGDSFLQNLQISPK